MYVRFDVRVECKSLAKNCEDSEVCDLFVTSSRVDIGQPAKGHVRSIYWNLNNLLLGCILRVIS